MARSAMHLPDAVTGARRHRAACECVLYTHTRITPAQLDWALSRVDLARDSILAQTCQCLRCARIGAGSACFIPCQGDARKGTREGVS